jgi:hypothetical protein
MKRIIVKAFGLALLVSLVSVQPALAYIDPSTGGMLFQALATALALFSGVALIFSRQIRMAFARAMRFLRGLFNRDDQRVEGARAHSERTEVEER